MRWKLRKLSVKKFSSDIKRCWCTGGFLNETRKYAESLKGKYLSSRWSDLFCRIGKVLDSWWWKLGGHKSNILRAEIHVLPLRLCDEKLPDLQVVLDWSRLSALSVISLTSFNRSKVWKPVENQVPSWPYGAIAALHTKHDNVNLISLLLLKWFIG